MNDVERKARDVLMNVDKPLFFDYGADAAIKALSRAGLLVTPLHERALELAKDWTQHHEVYCLAAPNRCEVLKGLSAVGREALAAKKPEERWTVQPNNGLGANTSTFKWVVRCGISAYYYISEVAARADAAVLNAEDREAAR